MIRFRARSSRRVASERMTNRERVLRIIIRAGALPRVELAHETGLTPAAISNITRELLDDGLLREVGVARGGRVGPNAILLDLPDDIPVLGAVHQGVSALRVGLCTLRGRVLARRIIATPQPYTPEWAVTTITKTLYSLLAEQGIAERYLTGVGCGLVGLTDTWHGISKRVPSLGWVDAPFERMLSDAVGRPVVIENNVRAMAFGEALLGNCRDRTEFAFVYVGTGIGAGLIVDGQPYRGAYGGAGEIGHMTVAPEGEQCSCGNRGCLETVVAEPAILRRAAQRGRDFQVAGANPKVGIRSLVTQALAGDEVARAVISTSGESLGVALANLVDIFNPDRIVVHGVITDAGALFFDPAARVVHERAFLAQDQSIALVAPTFGEDAGLVGASAVAIDAIVLRDVPMTPTPDGELPVEPAEMVRTRRNMRLRHQ